VAPETFELAYSPAERAALAQHVTFLGSPTLELETLRRSGPLHEVEALFTGWASPTLDARLLDALPGLRVLFHAGGSVKFLASDEFWRRRIRLTSATRANAIPVAEYTFAHTILALKRVLPLAQATRGARAFVRDDAATPSTFQSTVGLLSLGTIGRMVAARLRSLDVRVIGYDPYVSASSAAGLGVELCSMEELFTRADVVSCHTPLLDSTQHLLRAEHFSRMKPHATFINTARGSIVCEVELIDVLQRRPDLFAILDVTDPEPPPSDSPLYTLPNVFVTPHLSGSIGPECRRMGQMMLDEVRRYLASQPLLGEVTQDELSMLA
ncbi:MAG TPA: hydroxyacid dehydrogenase, partial [Candidatus Synoicihabitans sp.]|nr:hydroxyacid dehydrogenase [Candidatus Synoicihabitans sp.]